MGSVTPVKVSKKGQFPIPEEIREGMGIIPSEDFKSLSVNIRRKLKRKGSTIEADSEAGK